MEFQAGQKIHLVGIGGVGMSGLAKVLLEKGMSISGSDTNPNAYTSFLSSQGAKVFEGHKASHVRDAGLVVYSSSIGARNAELLEARRLKKTILSRLALFQEFTRAYKSIMVTGTHGKTTTAGMVSHILLNLGLDPTVLLGGDLYPFGNARLGKSEYLVAELDESDGEFVNVKPSLAIITNVENDHLDCFGSISNLNSAFRKFISNMPPGKLIFFSEDKNLQKLKSHIKRENIFTYGFDSRRDYHAKMISTGPKPRFGFFHRKRLLGEVLLSVPGRHNVLNAVAAISAVLSLGIEFDRISKTLSHFKGVARRFELKGEVNGIRVIEDYAHHPTEIKATLAAARLHRPRRILAVFQPHRYTRTRLLMNDFSSSFSDADILALTEIYSASERNTSGVSSRALVRLMKNRNHKAVSYFKTPEAAARFIAKEAKEGDMIFILGAGDVNRISKQILEYLQKQKNRFAVPSRRFSVQQDVLWTAAGIQGHVYFNEPLSRHTTFNIGGPARIFAMPSDKEDLKNILSISRRYSVPYYVIGNGSNLLVNDRGVDGVVIKLDGSFSHFSFSGNKLIAGGGTELSILRNEACMRGLSGLEFTAGIPGTLGGAIAMNAGACSSDIGGLVIRVEVMNKNGRSRRLSKREMNFAYRRSSIEKGSIIVKAELRLKPAASSSIKEKISSIWKKRKRTQPIGELSAGSIFKNPHPFVIARSVATRQSRRRESLSAGSIIDKAGLKGASCGRACISPIHANFIINRGGATSRDVLKLMATVKRGVSERFGINLESEIIIW